MKEEEEIKIEDPDPETKLKRVLTPLELEGLWNLLGKLEELPDHKKCVPAGIGDAAALLEDMRAVLLAHADDDPKLSYTGEPIVKWPKRPSWYQPPLPPPPSVLYRPRLGPKTKRSSKKSISALRRRRVRCKRCVACRRKECGKCQYCHDMRKFGGPGRMKKSCVMRQCLAPALPNTARCAICGEGEPEDSHPSTHTLMECSVCNRIAHPRCIKEPGEGKISKDLPSCWECPRCYQGKGSGSESSSDEESGESEGSNPYPGEGNGGEAVRRAKRSKPASHPTAPPPSQKLLLQHQQNRKRASALEQRLKKRIKLERSKIMAQKRVALERSPRMLSSSLLARLRSPTSRLASQSRGRGANWSSSTAFYASTTASGSFQQQQSSLNNNVSKDEPRRGRGRGVRLRGGGAGRGLHRDANDSEDSSSSSSSSNSSSSEDDNDEEENGAQKTTNGGDKENQPQSQPGATKEEEQDVNDNQIFEEELEQETESNNKVTLQRPSKAQRDPSGIVPKLEAIASSTTSSILMKPTMRPPIRQSFPDLHQSTTRHTPPITRSRHGDTCKSHHQERLGASKRTKECNPVKLNNGGASSSSSDLPHPRMPLSALQEGGSEADRDSSGTGTSCEREVLVSVFRYLSRAELCVCMAVCKNWYKWCLDKRLWSKIDLSIKRTVTPQALLGIIKRQPVTLDLSWTNISKKKLNWLIGRLPGLKDLMLAGCSWTSISALCTSSCPLLRSLDLRYADGVKDCQIRELVTPPGCDNRSQLRVMQSLRLSGLDISDSTLRLVIRHMPQLTKLDLSHCNSLTDHSINLLTAVGSSTRNTLTELNLEGCSKLTDACLKYLRRLSCISLLNLRGCKGVSRKACEGFISELSVNTLYCLSDDKIIARIS